MVLILMVENLSVEWGGCLFFEKVDLMIVLGEIVGLVGLSGVGKSFLGDVFLGFLLFRLG